MVAKHWPALAVIWAAVAGAAVAQNRTPNGDPLWQRIDQDSRSITSPNAPKPSNTAPTPATPPAPGSDPLWQRIDEASRSAKTPPTTQPPAPPVAPPPPPSQATMPPPASPSPATPPLSRELAQLQTAADPLGPAAMIVVTDSFGVSLWRAIQRWISSDGRKLPAAELGKGFISVQFIQPVGIAVADQLGEHIMLQNMRRFLLTAPR